MASEEVAAVDMEVVVEVMAEAVAVAEEDTVVVEAADTDLPDLLTCSSHLLLILLHLTQKP